jgi:hypothetical protein
MSWNPLKKPGCIVAVVVVFGLISLLLLGLGIAAIFGDKRDMSFECDRTSGKCVLHDRVDRPFALADIKDVELKSGDVHVSSNTYEKQSWITAHLANGKDVELAEGSGNAESRAEYARAAADIHAFLAGNAPKVDAHYAVRLGTTSIVSNLSLGVFGLVLFVGIPILWLRSKKRDDKAFAEAMALRERQDEGASPPTSG